MTLNELLDEYEAPSYIVADYPGLLCEVCGKHCDPYPTHEEVDSFIEEHLRHEFEDYDESMDGDHESALASIGWGTDEDYGYYGDDGDNF